MCTYRLPADFNEVSGRVLYHMDVSKPSLLLCCSHTLHCNLNHLIQLGHLWLHSHAHVQLACNPALADAIRSERQQSHALHQGWWPCAMQWCSVMHVYMNRTNTACTQQAECPTQLAFLNVQPEVHTKRRLCKYINAHTATTVTSKSSTFCFSSAGLLTLRRFGDSFKQVTQPLHCHYTSH